MFKINDSYLIPRSFLFLLVRLAALFVSPFQGGGFSNYSTLEEVYASLKSFMPTWHSNLYVEPDGITMNDFELIVSDMIEDQIDCDEIDLRSLLGKYQIGTFVDQDNLRTYCIFATTSIDYPWGNVIIDTDSSTSKKLSFDCPHPLHDLDTGEQGIALLKGTTSRSWIVSGSDRNANTEVGSCQPNSHFGIADAAHSKNNCFQSAVSAIKKYYQTTIRSDYTAISLHGMGISSCIDDDTFFTHGSCVSPLVNNIIDGSDTSTCGEDEAVEATQPGMAKISILTEAANNHPSDTGLHTQAGDGCRLCGGTNVQGRLINGVPADRVCDTHAASVNGQFVHLEQKRDYRRSDEHSFWIDVFNTAYGQFGNQVCT